MRKNLFRLSIFFVLVIALSVGQYALQKNGFYDVRSIEIQQAEIEAGTERYFKSVSLGIYAQLKKFEGMSLFHVNLSEVHTILSQQLWIEEFHVKRKWPNGLNIKVKTKQVLVNLAERNQLVSPISVDGEKLPAVEMKYAPDRVFFDRVKMYSDTELREKSLAVLKEIPRDGKFSHSSISVLGFEKDSGFWAKLVDRDIKVQLGFEGISVKSKRVSQVINHLQNAGIDPRVIEADMNKKVLVKTRKTLSN